jgi:hypothetical protein
VPPTLDEVLEPLKPTDDQRKGIHRVIDQARQERRGWWAVRGAEILSLQKQLVAAHEASDAAKLSEARDRWKAAIKTVPPSAAAWEKIRADFSPDQQRALGPIERDVRRAISHELHQAVRLQDSLPPGASPMAACSPCHMPRQYLVDDH